MTEVTTIGLDIAKNVFHAHGADATGQMVFSRKLTRAKLLDFFAAQPSCLIAMEACGGAHHWARQLAQLGHSVRLIPPAYVKPFVNLCAGEHNFTNHEVAIQRRNAARLADFHRFCSFSSALFQSVSSQASTLASRFQDGWLPVAIGTATFSRAFRFVSRLALA